MKEDKVIRIREMEEAAPDSVLAIFFLFSFLGWIWEGVFVGIRYGMFLNRGFLHGPWLPIYGTGGLLMVYFLKDLRHKPALVYTGCVLLCAIVEYFTGFLLETFYHMKWWDYSSFPLNLKGRICPQDTMFFGVFGMFAVYYAVPYCLKKMSDRSRLRWGICILLTILFSVDMMVSLISPNTGLGITY
ncbi:MAG: putative ABC transporter permease [Lachnospiraceae bacterium]|nr:putative ABC transporter permease [Lachnospiraceae bacterium]